MSTSATPIAILHLDDDPSDAALVASILGRWTVPHRVSWVQTGERFQAALEERPWDVILSDWRMPGYDGDRALALARELAPHTPFIMVTGELGEDRAIETLKRGAWDYVLKDNLKRVVPAVERALAEARDRRERVEAEARHADIVQSIRDPLFLIDRDDRFTYVNAPALEVWGRRAEELLGRRLPEVFPDAVASESWENLQRATRERVVLHYEARSPVLGHWIAVSCYPTHDGGATVTFRDIQREKDLAEALKRAEDRFRVAQELSPDAFTIFRPRLGPDGRVSDFLHEYANPAAVRQGGMEGREVVDRGFLELFPDPQNRLFFEAFREAFETSRPVEVERSFLGGAHETRQWYRAVIVPLADRIAVLSQDTTARKVAEAERDEVTERYRTKAAELESSRAQLEAVLHAMRDGVTAFDATGACLFVNAAQRRIDALQAQGAGPPAVADFPNVYALETPDGVPVPVEEWPVSKVLRGESVSDWLLVGRRTDTGRRWTFRFSGEPVRDAEGRVVLGVVITRDVTDEAAAAERARTADEWLEVALGGLADGFQVFDRDFRWVYIGHVDEARFDAMGVDARHLLGKCLWDAFPSLRGTPAEAALREAMRTRVPTVYEREFQGRWYEVHVYPTAGGGLSLLSPDITDRKHWEEQSRRFSDRLEARVRERTLELERLNHDLEMFSVSVSHDLKAPLRAIHTYTSLVLDGAPNQLGAEQRLYLGRVRESAARMAHLIESLLTFSHMGAQELRLDTVDVDRLARAVVEEQLAAASTPTEVTVAPLPPARADATLLRQVFENLLSNALKYSARAASPKVEIGGHEDGDGCVYWVADNGIGFEAAYAERIFGPFERLHRPEEYPGAGIGLATVRRVIERLGGAVWAEAERNAGARFTFRLPR